MSKKHGIPSFVRDAAIFDAQTVARSLGGIVAGGNILAPGPGHSANDLSLSVKIDPKAQDGFIVHSFAGDSVAACRDHVRAALGLKWGKGAFVRPSDRMGRSSADGAERLPNRLGYSLHLWNEASDPRGTVVTDYLSSRGLPLPDGVAGRVVRYHPMLKFDGNTFRGMIALFRDINTNAPCGVQRTFLDADGRKVGRAMLGRTRHAAIKIDPDENVDLSLTLGEGFETTLAASLAGFRPAWSTGSATGITSFPVLGGVEVLTILGEVSDGGANERATHRCAARWMAAGREAFLVKPLVGDDFNDAWREATP
ncbi:DUF7146 domain-containing protein [Bradyrhizobium japonicum]|uniref:DUF7146 domain-containing protein n=1 Tax=Bradyrhizobium japonicum TaxID=375 RepID=UPI000675FEDE|nr:toprim domain-containing protein [Bradyrhizobium japonicum]